MNRRSVTSHANEAGAFFPTVEGHLQGIPPSDFGDVLYRYAYAQLLDVEHHLDRPGTQRHAGIHEARKALRRCRAALSLRPDARASEEVVSIDRGLRRLAKGLSGLRDAEVAMLRASEQFERCLDDASRDRWRAMRDRLMGHRDDLERKALQADPEFRKRRQSAQRLRDRLGALDWSDVDAGHLRKNLRRSAARLLRAETSAQEHATVANLHRLRRRARHLRTQRHVLQSLSEQPSVPPALRKIAEHALAKAARKLPDPHTVSAQVDQLGARQDWHLLRSAVRRYADAAEIPSLLATLPRSPKN